MSLINKQTLIAPKALDLFCGGGGASVGLYRAGFDVVGVDNKPQKNYPFQFIQADALKVRDFLDLSFFDFIWASPMCQRYSKTKSLHKNNYPEQIPEIREILTATGKPFIIENVEDAPLLEPVLLCGTMFGLKVIRHRIFESNVNLHTLRPPCFHHGKTAKRGEYDSGQRGFVTVVGGNFSPKFAREAMRIGWMTKKELAQAIPPDYSEFLGKIIRQNL